MAVSVAIVEWPFNGPGNEIVRPSGEETNFLRTQQGNSFVSGSGADRIRGSEQAKEPITEGKVDRSQHSRLKKTDGQTDDAL